MTGPERSCLEENQALNALCAVLTTFSMPSLDSGAADRDLDMRHGRPHATCAPRRRKRDTRVLWAGARAGLLAVLALAVCLAVTVVPATAARAATSPTQAEMNMLRNTFGVDTSLASDQDLTRLLDSPIVGQSLSGDVACANVGLHGLDESGAEQDLLGILATNSARVVSANTQIDDLLGQVDWSKVPAGDEIANVIELHSDLSQIQANLPLLVTTLKDAESQGPYVETLSQYYDYWNEENGDAAAAAQDMQEFSDKYLSSLASDRSLSEDTLLAQFAYDSSCMHLVQDSKARDGYRLYIGQLVTTMHAYAGEGPGLVLVPQSGGIEMINVGDGEVTNPVLQDQQGRTVAGGPNLAPGEIGKLPIDSSQLDGTEALHMTVDGISDVSVDYSRIVQSVYFGGLRALDVPGDPMAREFNFALGPFISPNAPQPTYSWDFGDGGGLNNTDQVDVTHEYPCPGTYTAKVTASGVSASLQPAPISVTVPPTFNLDYGTDGTNYAIAPGVPLTFRADSSVPAGATITWSFGDGSTDQGRVVTHTYTTAGAETATMSVTPPGSPCPHPLTQRHTITVGRSSDWIPLPSPIPNGYVMNSTVAGYVASGPTTITPGSTVTVEPGTNIKFTGLNGEPGQIWANGTLDVEGAASAPAVFTSRYDDSAGGHCSCAGTGTPSQGDWYGLSTSLTGGTIILNHADLRYASAGVDLQGTGARATLNGSTVEHSGTGLHSAGDNAINVQSSILSGDNTGLKFECFGCSYGPIVTGTSFYFRRHRRLGHRSRRTDPQRVPVRERAYSSCPAINCRSHGDRPQHHRCQLELRQLGVRLAAHRISQAELGSAVLPPRPGHDPTVRATDARVRERHQGLGVAQPGAATDQRVARQRRREQQPGGNHFRIRRRHRRTLRLRAWRPQSRRRRLVRDHDLGRRQRRAHEHHDPVCRERGRPGRFRVERERRQQHTRGLRQRDLCRRRDPHPPLFHA